MCIWEDAGAHELATGFTQVLTESRVVRHEQQTDNEAASFAVYWFTFIYFDNDGTTAQQNPTKMVPDCWIPEVVSRCGLTDFAALHHRTRAHTVFRSDTGRVDHESDEMWEIHFPESPRLGS